MFQIHRLRLQNPRARQILNALLTYLAIAGAAFAFNHYRMNAKLKAQEEASKKSYAERMAGSKPFFSLSTNRNFMTQERARLSTSYHGIEYLDFRVYKIQDPVKFFQKLPDPHRVGEDEKENVERDYQRSASMIERTHSVKSWIYAVIKEYVRDQLKQEARQTFNEKFRKEEAKRQPLNVADYARVPLLNPNQLVSSWRERLSPMQDEYDRRTISLGQREAGVYLVEAVNGDLRAYCVAIVTNLTMVQKSTRSGEVMVYVVDRETGAPREGADIVMLGDRQLLSSGRTGKDGIFKAEIERKEKAQPEGEDESEAHEGGSYLLMARQGDEFAISDLESFYYGAGDGEGGDQSLTSYIYTDRPVYRPGQKAYFKGILRRRTMKGYEMVEPEKVSVTVEDFNGAKLSEQELALSSRGTFSGEVEIPEEAPLGDYQLIAHVGESTASHYFSVEEYEKPEYKVQVTGPKEFLTVGERAKFSIDARYFFGSPVAGAEVQYYISRSRYYHYWRDTEQETDEAFDDSEEMGDDDYYDRYAFTYGGDFTSQGEGTLDAKGHLTVEFDVPAANDTDEWDYTYRIDAHVVDDSRREMQGSARFIATRGRTIAYAQPESYIHYQGEQARINVRTADYTGRAVAARVTLKFIEQRWERVEKESPVGYKYSDYESRERELLTDEVETDARGLAAYNYTPLSTGNIYIKAVIHEDGKEVINRGGSFWVSDRKNEANDFSFRDYDESSIKLIPDKKSYQPGDTAHVLAVLPVEGTHLLVTTELLGVMTARALDAPGRTLMLDVPIESAYEPDIYLSVAYVKHDELYTEEQMLAVPARDKFLRVEVVPNKKEYKPRETASYTVTARDADGTPAAGAEVSLGVVDEAIYSIMPEESGSIRGEFYGKEYNEVETSLANFFSFTGYSGKESVELTKGKPAYELADFKSDSEFADPIVRRLFKDTAFWQPDVVTGADGRATVQFKLPDNLTTWRATARAVTADTRVGAAVEKVVARKDVIMRLEMPRFLTEGDTVIISGLVHNFLKTKKRTRISIEVDGAQLVDAASETVIIPSMGQKRIDWRVTARQAGEVRLLAKALTDTESDAVEMSIPIVPHGLRQTIGRVEVVSEEAADKTLSLDLPAHPDVQARKLRIEASPSVAATLFGALDYLTGYPYGCTEQTMSRFLPDIVVAQALKDVPQAYISEKNNLNEKVENGLKRLYSFQHDDGGWGWWKNDESDPFMTAYVVDGLAKAVRAGYMVDETRLNVARDRLKTMLDDNQTDLETRAYMTYALTESGGDDSSYVDALYSNRNGLQPYGRALLALALNARDDNRANEVAGELEQTANANDFEAHWESRLRSHYGGEQVMDVEATALALKALSQISPQSAMLPKVARWLVGNRRNGYYWTSTRETAFVIFGLTEYLKASHELDPDYTLEVYLNDERVISRRVTAEDARSAQTFLVERKGRALNSSTRVRIIKRGRGTLYLSTALEYFTGEDEVAADGSNELKLEREYLRLRVDENGGKPTWTLEPLTGEVRSGDYIVSRLRLQGARARYVMIEDPIPAGCTQVNRIDGWNPDYTTRNWTDWYSAREFRDNRTVFFLNSFDGDAMFQYAMRVEVPGVFRVAPARAELMYQPTVQSNTGNMRLSILEVKQR